MDFRRRLYWTALILVALVALGLHGWGAWLWINQHLADGSWAMWRGRHHPSGAAFVALGFIVFAGVGAWFYRFHRTKAEPLDPLGDLAQTYVDGRITREEFYTRKGVLEETK